jgi:hypothetical protein
MLGAVFSWLEWDVAGFIEHASRISSGRSNRSAKDVKFPDLKRLPGPAFLEEVK